MTRRECRSRITARYSHPSGVQIWLMSSDNADGLMSSDQCRLD